MLRRQLRQAGQAGQNVVVFRLEHRRIKANLQWRMNTSGLDNKIVTSGRACTVVVVVIEMVLTVVVGVVVLQVVVMWLVQLVWTTVMIR